jgi:predicted DNA-binding antitoxin AbrB/MazE fold protein
VKGTVEAVFEDGVFRPLRPPNLLEGERVRLTVESVDGAGVTDILALATSVYEGLSPGDIDDIEESARRRAFFTYPVP